MRAGTLLWCYLLEPHADIGRAFYFAVVTFTTIGYGDVTPATTVAKVFFMVYVTATLVVQLTVLTTLIGETLQAPVHVPEHDVVEGDAVRPCLLYTSPSPRD